MIDLTTIATAAKIVSKFWAEVKKFFTDKEIARNNRAIEKETERHHTITEGLQSKKQEREHIATLETKRKNSILELKDKDISIRMMGVESLIEVANSYATDTTLDLKTEERARKINNILGYLCRYIQNSSEQNAEKINDIPVRKKYLKVLAINLKK